MTQEPLRPLEASCAPYPEWFRVPWAHAEPLWGLPGSRLVGSATAANRMMAAHRTHLPLLDPALASGALPPRDSSAEVWAEREAWCLEHGFKPRVTQQQGLDFARYRRGVLLADDMRLGKTLLSVLCDWQWRRDFMAAQTTKIKVDYGPLVIVAPLNTRAVWLGWVRRVFPDADIGVIMGRQFDAKILRKQVVFGHHDVIMHWQALFDIGTLVLDEAHLLTNREARRSQAAVVLAAKAKHVVACTGTPINQFPPDMWNVLALLAPRAWGNYYEFSDRYGAPEPTAYGKVYRGISNEAELQARLSEIMLRRLWRDCHSDLPPIARSIVVADVTQAQRNKLDLLAAKLKSERANTAANLAVYRKQVTTIKLPLVVARLKRVMDRDVPVVGWTWHRDFAERIHADLIETGYTSFVIHGEVPIAERERRMDAWRATKNGALIANMAVAAAGIDLSHAAHAVVGELDYTPSMLGQAEMRTFSPTRPMDVEFVVANHTVDQRIVRSLVSKLSASDPLGLGAAIDAIDALRDAVMGPTDEGDLDRLLEGLLSGD